jgi:hypothetical protein
LSLREVLAVQGIFDLSREHSSIRKRNRRRRGLTVAGWRVGQASKVSKNYAVGLEMHCPCGASHWALDEIDRLIRFLDDTDNHMEREPDGDEDEDSDPAEFDIPDEDSDPAEPSLGSLDHHLNQEQWAAGSRRDLEQDDGETGIADQDGLDEQVPCRDWQGVGTV